VYFIFLLALCDYFTHLFFCSIFEPMWASLLTQIKQQNIKALARCISLVENEMPGYLNFLATIPTSTTPVIGITGPPGAGKSTLVDAVIDALVMDNKKVAILCVDPSSPFNLGALLGDRIRMSSWYNHPNVYIRSLATRGSLGGLHPKIIEISDVLKIAGFDYILIETVGVGQSEIEIAGLADCTVVVMVPEAGDDIQTMKAGLMEIADIFVVNKSDRPAADIFVKNLRQMLAPAFHQKQHEIAIVKTIAIQKLGIDMLLKKIQQHLLLLTVNNKRNYLLAEKAFQLIQHKRMATIDKQQLLQQINDSGANFNLYTFIQNF
jgi:LAO/AO transport system kinase